MTRLDHGVLNIPGRLQNIDRDLDRYKSQQSAAAATARKEAAMAFKSDKARAKELYDQCGAALIAKHAAKFGAKEITNLLTQMVKWEPKKFIALAESFASKQRSLT